MSGKSNHVQDLRGLSRLTTDAVTQITHLVEAVHLDVVERTGSWSGGLHRPVAAATRGVYRAVRGITQLAGMGVGALIGGLQPLLGERSGWPGREPMVAALNGVLGDYLVASANPLAIPMQLRVHGKALRLEREALAHAFPHAGRRVMVMVHGLCMSDLSWHRRRHDHGAALARALGCNVVYLRYNSGLHVSTNGREFAGILEQLVQAWPVPIEQLDIIGYSMGGLLARSAHHYALEAAHSWPARLARLAFVGTPHHGAPLERRGNWLNTVLGISPYTARFTRIGNVRSAGITDLRHGNLLDEDWQTHGRFHHHDNRQLVPLPPHTQCFAIAGTLGLHDDELKGRLLGDGLVPTMSALGQHSDAARVLPIPSERQWIAYGANHLDLLNRKDVYEQLLNWLG